MRLLRNMTVGTMSLSLTAISDSRSEMYTTSAAQSQESELYIPMLLCAQSHPHTRAGRSGRDVAAAAAAAAASSGNGGSSAAAAAAAAASSQGRTPCQSH